jgi:hypothetical protein
LAVAWFGLLDDQAVVGEQAVVPPRSEQFALAFGDAGGFKRLTRRTISRAVTWYSSFLDVNAV